MGSVHVRVGVPGDAAALRALRLRGVREHPRAFLVSADEEEARSTAEFAEQLATRWAAADNGILGAWLDGSLVGMLGFFRDTRPKVRHRFTIWGVYVAPEARGRGVGDALFVEALARIRAIPEATDVQLAVGTFNTAAIALYERHGFRTWGVEPRTMRVGDAWVDEAYMSLRLTCDGRGAPGSAGRPR